MAIWIGCRVYGEMIPQPTASRLVSRATSADSAVDERASIECFRHHGYASASQIVSNPASSMTCACSRISSSGSIVSCMTPTLKGAGVMRLLAGEGARELRPAQERAAERAARAVVLQDRVDVRRVQRLLTLVLDLQRREVERPDLPCGDGEDQGHGHGLRGREGRELAEPDPQHADDLQAHAALPVGRLAAGLQRQLRMPAVGDQRDGAVPLGAGLLVGNALADRRGGCRRRGQRERGGDENGEDDENALHAVTFAWSTWSSSALSTFETCWFTIGWKTRWPMLPIGPATWMSAIQFILVLSPSSGSRWNSVSMPTIAPTPWPLALSFAYSIGRASACSNLNFSFRPPMPSGTFTFADQCVSSCTSKLSTPGRSCEIREGSIRTSHTV